MIHFRILDDTLCGAEYKEPSRRAAKNGRLCNECINVIWREQYRRNTLLTYVKKVGSIPPTPLDDELKEDMRAAWTAPEPVRKKNEKVNVREHDDSEEVEAGLYLIDFKVS